MSGEGYRTLLDCRYRSRVLRAAGFTYDQIVAVLALDHDVSPLRLYRYAHGHTARHVTDEFGQLDPAASATLREARLYDFENWPGSGRRPPAWVLAILARIYQTRARQLLSDQTYGTYRPGEQDVIDGADHHRLDIHQPPARVQPTSEHPDVRWGLGTESSVQGPVSPDVAPAIAAQDCEDLFQAVRTQEIDTKRGNSLVQLALTLGGAPALGLLRNLSPDEIDRLAHALRTPGALDTRAVTAIEKLTARCWHLDDILGSREILPIADAQLGMVRRLLQHGSLTPALRNHVLAAHWHLSHLAGWVHFDSLDHHGAIHRYTEGLAAAHQIGDPVALAHLHGCLANVAVFQAQSSKALDHIYAARGWAKRSNSRLQKAATATMTARVIAATEKNPICLHLLDQATDLADDQAATAPLHLFWCTPARVSWIAAPCLTQLDRANDAIEARQRMLKELPASLVRVRADLILETTPALISKREIPAAAEEIATAARMTDHTTSARLKELIRRVRRHLDPWDKMSQVHNLDVYLQARGIIITP